MKEKPICTRCGSDDILADAWAEWDVEAQQWVLRTTFDDKHCEACEGECRIKWVEAKDEDEDEDEVA
jgi:hypothetical protein